MKQGEMSMAMPGIPNWLFLTAVAAIIAVSFVIIEYLGRREAAQGDAREDYPKWDLLRLRMIKWVVKRRLFQPMMQFPFVLAFLFIIYAGLFGTSVTYMNIAPILTWTIWWAGIILAILFLGKIWCLVCPWNAIAEWIQRLGFWKRRDNTLSLNLRWPKGLRNIYLATGLFVGLTWLELGFGVTFSPFWTAILGLLILFLAVTPALYFERKSFCRYGCLVGRVSGLYSMFAGTELRSRDKGVCRSCHTKDCLWGNEKGYGCPTYEYMGNMELNTYCILCTECVKTCPRDNIAFNIRPFATDLLKFKRARPDEAYLSIIMLAMASFHGLTMTQAWRSLTGAMQALSGIGQMAVFTVGMAGIILLPAGIYFLFTWISKAVSGNRDVPLRTLFLNYAFSLLPIALLYHLAHNVMHLFGEGQRLIPTLSDPLGRGWDLFGTANVTYEPLLPLAAIWYIQVFLVVVGQIYGVYIAHKVAVRTFGDRRQALRSQIPMLTLIVVYSLVSLWLLWQPMEMRMAMI